MPWTNDPVSDYNRYCEEQERYERRLPKCCCCDHHIGDDFLYVIEDDIYCEECMKDEFRRLTEDFMDE